MMQSQANIGQTAQGAAAASTGILDGAISTLQGLADPTAQIRQQMGALQTDLRTMWNDTIMPGIATDAIAAGGLGGGRQGVAQGVAAGAMGDALTSGAADIYGRANAQAASAAGMLPAMADARYNTQLAPYNAAWGPLQQYAGILGPAIQNQFSRSYGAEQSRGKSQSAGFSIFG